MPGTSELTRFKKDLRALAREDEIREEWGEPYEDAEVPSGGLESDLSALLDDKPRRAPDPAALFSDIPLEPGDSAAPPSDDGFALPGGLDDFGGPDGLDHFADLEKPPERRPRAAAEPAGFDAADLGIGDLAGAGGPSEDREDGGFDLAGFAEGAFGTAADEDSGLPPSDGLDGEVGAGLADFGKDIADFGSLDGFAAGDGEGDFSSVPSGDSDAFGETDAPGDAASPDFAAAFSDAGEGFAGGFGEPGAANAEDDGFSAFSPGDAATDDAVFDLAAFAAPGGDSPDEAAGSGDGFSLGGETTDGFESGPAEPDSGIAAFDSGFDDSGFSPVDQAEPRDAHENFSLDGAFAGFDSGGFAAPFPEGPSVEAAARGGTRAPSDSDEPDLASAFGGAASGARPKGRAGGKGGRGTGPRSSFTEDEVDRMQDSLLSYPLNLRLAVESIFAEDKGDEESQARLATMLADGANARTVADLASRVLKKPIEIPKGFERRTGAAFEARKGTFAYAFVHNFLPLLEIVGAALAGLAVVGLLVWNLVVVPLQAEALYERGMAYIAAERYDESWTAFRQAQKLRIVKEWYYRYAEAYDAKDQLPRAEAAYRELLDVWPKDVKGALDFASMYRGRRNWARAVEVLETKLLNWDYFNLEGLVALGDTALEWADEDVAALERARLAYAKAIEAHGQTDLVMERMMIYMIRAEAADGKDRREDVYSIRDRFMSSSKTKVSSRALAELAGYMMDRGDIPGVYQILVRAVQQDPDVAEVYWRLARYYRIASSPEEPQALAEAERLFQARRVFDRRGLVAWFDTLDRFGQWYLGEGRAIDAERYFRAAIDLYEKQSRAYALKPAPLFGGAYAHLADVSYYYGGAAAFEEAIRLYDKAAAELHETPETHYKRGWLHFQLKRWDRALRHFHLAGIEGAEPDNLLFATAVTLFKRNDLFAAEGYYLRLMRSLREKLRNESELDPQQRDYQKIVVKMLMESAVNLGVVIYRSAERSGDSARRAEAMALFVQSTEFFDALRRDRATLERLSMQFDNYGYLNISSVLHPELGMSLLSFDVLERDMTNPLEK